MPFMTSYDFGDVILVPFPFTDQVGSKKRPAVIISAAAYNVARLDVILMAITSQIRTTNLFGEVEIVEWQKAGLLKASIVKPVLTTIEKSLILRQLGRLDLSDRVALQKVLPIILG